MFLLAVKNLMDYTVPLYLFAFSLLFCQGGITFVAVKGAVRIYYKQQQYVRQAHRIVKDYGES